MKQAIKPFVIAIALFFSASAFSQSQQKSAAAPAADEPTVRSTAVEARTKVLEACEGIEALRRELKNKMSDRKVPASERAALAASIEDAKRALGPGIVLCRPSAAGSSGDVVSTAKSQVSTSPVARSTADAVAEFLRQTQTQLPQQQLVAAKPACESHYVSVRDGVVTQGPCKGNGDEVIKYNSPAPVVIQAPAPQASRVIDVSPQQSSGVAIVQPAAPTPQASNQGGRVVVVERCNFRVGGQIVDFKMFTTSAVGGAREECLAWQRMKSAEMDKQQAGNYGQQLSRGY